MKGEPMFKRAKIGGLITTIKKQTGQWFRSGRGEMSGRSGPAQAQNRLAFAEHRAEVHGSCVSE
jgi:hypothetical protein